MAGIPHDPQAIASPECLDTTCDDCEFDLHVASADFGFLPEGKDCLFARLRSFSIDEPVGDFANPADATESKRPKREQVYPDRACGEWERSKVPKTGPRPPSQRSSPVPGQLPLDSAVSDINSDAFSSWKTLRAKSLEERKSERRALALNLLKHLWTFNSTELAKLIQRHCHNQVMYISPTVREPIFGKQDLMLFFALSMEQYPDSTASILSVEVADDKVVVVFDFKATNICPHALGITFQELKPKFTKAIIPPGVITLTTGQRIVCDIADRIRPGVIQRLAAIGKIANPDLEKNRKSSGHSSEDEQDRSSPDEGAVQPTVVTMHRDFDMQGYLRTSNTGNAIMKEGVVSFRRHLNFYFDDYDMIIRMTSFNI